MTPRISVALSAAALLGAAILTTTSAYAADPTALSATGALQQVDVPEGTCSATVTAVGGNGGQATTAGGHGASVTATVPIVSGTLTVVVGTPGIRGSRMSDQDPLMSSPDFDPYVGSGGGGGGTFVFEGASTTDAGLLVAAGGGGGGSRNTVPPGLDGATTPDGTRGNDIWVFDGGGAGGTGGLGGGYDPYGGGNGGGGLRGGGNGY
ncbi:MAG TPA: hypothetical protein VN088_14000, partial [Nocardioides sp.]|nr:hypothetical protein [Nocardioides sp.]